MIGVWLRGSRRNVAADAHLASENSSVASIVLLMEFSAARLWSDHSNQAKNVKIKMPTEMYNSTSTLARNSARQP
jgi:hypothetical protein